MSEKEEETTEWITQSDLASAMTSRRSSSSRRTGDLRPQTGKSNGNQSLSRDGSVGSAAGAKAMGSVRKRLSRLKLGKKSSKASVLVDSVTEEED